MSAKGDDLAELIEARKSKRQRAAELAEQIAAVEREGFIVHRPLPPKDEVVPIDLRAIRGDRIKLAVVSDTHLGSKFQQPTALRDFLRYAKRSGCKAVLHGGDVTDGPVARHRNPTELFLHDFQSHVDYAVETLPNVGLPWYVISGNHDDWHLADGGADVVRAICAARDDFTYVGRSGGYVTLKDVLIEMHHPDKGGSYAYSYGVQKHIESLAPARKAPLALIGNHHKLNVLFYRNVWGVLLPGFQAQSFWMAGKSLVSDVGGMIVEVGASPKGMAPSFRFEAVMTYEPREDWP
jgi:predicted phosphodiesterase